jgi:hypothetical protein
MDFGRIAKRLRQVVDKRGGTEALKEDLSELQQIAKQKGSLPDKAKEAGTALKDPGAPGRSAEVHRRQGRG